MLAAITPAISVGSLLPEILLTVAGCAALLCGQSRADAVRRSVPWIALGAIVVAILLLFGAGIRETSDQIFNGLVFNSLTDFVRRSGLIVGLLVVLVSWTGGSSGERGEFFSMTLFALAGLLFVGGASDLVMLFLALELVSIPTYVLVTLSQWNARSLEAGTKYFYLGAMSAALTAFGFSYLYGVTGTAALDGAAVDRVIAALAAPGTMSHALALVGLLFSLGGLLFKLAAFPLHLYVADVYEGASSPVAGLLGFLPKIAGVIAIAKLLALTQWATTSGGLFWFLWIVAALSMTIGNVLALRQSNLKRMLAYSGIAHGGYMLVGLLAGPFGHDGSVGVAAAFYYVVVYGIANLGAFAVLGLLEVRGEPAEKVIDVAGLLRRAPGLALLLVLAMFTLMGMPPTPGFWGKLGLFGSALAASGSAAQGHQPWIVALVILAVVNSAIGAAYYLRVIAACLLSENEDGAVPLPREAPHMGALLCGFLTLLFAFFPDVLMNAGGGASETLRSPPTLARAAPSADASPRIVTPGE